MTMSDDSASFSYATFGEVAPEDSGQLEGTAESFQARGYAIGYAQGIRAAESQAREQRERIAQAVKDAESARDSQHQAALQALTAALKAVESVTAPTIEAASNILIESALQLTEHILGKSLEDSAFAARAALERALEGREIGNPVRAIRMNAADLMDLGLSVAPATGIPLVSDPTLERGDALAECERGFVDARISSALRRASDALRSQSR